MIPHWAAGWWTCRSKPFCVTDCYWSRELAGTGDTWKRHCSVVSSLPGMNSLANSTLRKNWLHRYCIFSDWIFWCRLHPLILTKYSTKAIRKCKGHQGNKKEEFYRNFFYLTGDHRYSLSEVPVDDGDPWQPTESIVDWPQPHMHLLIFFTLHMND